MLTTTEGNSGSITFKNSTGNTTESNRRTAMQRMLDDLLAKRDVYENAKMYECVATLETSIEIAQFLLEKEKEQIADAFRNGSTSSMLGGGHWTQYYNQTYNQNK